jgi:hypothetical protein
MVLNWAVVDVDRMAEIAVIYILADPYQTPPSVVPNTYSPPPRVSTSAQTIASYVAGRGRGSSRSISLV